MMLANLTPSPAVAAVPGADLPAAAPVTPGSDTGAPFASWLMFDIGAEPAVADTDTDTDSAQVGTDAVQADALADPGMLPDGAAPAVPAAIPEHTSTPAMTMSMTLPLGMVLPPAMPMPMPMPMPSSWPAAMAAPLASAAPLGAASAPLSFAAAATPVVAAGTAAAPAPAAPAAPFAAALPAAPASTVSFTFSAPPAASANATGVAASTSDSDSDSDSRVADARTPVAAAPALPAQALVAAPAPRAPARSADSATPAAPVAQKSGIAASAQPLAASTDPVLRSDTPVADPANVMNGANALAAPNAAMAAPLDVKLPANPADWQQPLRDALGDRLQLQLGRNIDQAVIRLDPPQLGRIEIAIRHAAGGVLEVNISATHSEVRRQLNSVSDAMRSDLAQRQFSDVAVTITATPRSGAAFGEQQGRQRQPEREPGENDPGRALAEAGQPSATFSLSGREVAA
ncbi:flagellar hook-length control protein FliK [Massilia antarctica]|uniref:flagellar hook-length control protein FliK n=1 Tax=Massilia antarctica TaxID=2765360 RepID=UPI00226D4747|nr:flagellar hook-length control protein FliK [Massilia sp. H27-R4]MCY0913174.1 flagellar hook-length control protein FliK [Massilia sp. H27-R4]